ncbi:MAG: hypothetical protein LBC48_00760 [Dysgonamonadaceae bacterium]|jgi:hypothetical protein|nr:hypothetical protein [Dysgonamonadaceae bacterium]
MDKLSEYIPLLIIIASVIISLIGKKKRPVKEILFPEEVFPEIEQPPLVHEPIPEKKIVKPVSQKIHIPEKKQHPVYKKNVDNNDIDEYESTNIDLSDPEEMKKAIIYSEIFNRKDF